MNESETFSVFKFGEWKWIKKLAEGHINFSCGGAYIKQANQDGNNEQGDKYEGVFARLKSNDPRIEHMKDLLGDDLETIDDGSFVLLRRQSAKKIPMFCFFKYNVEDLNKGCMNKADNNLLDVVLEFNPKIFEAFAKKREVDNPDERLTAINFRMQGFLPAVNNLIRSNFGMKAGARMGGIDYIKRSEEIFFIPPTNDYDELFFKRERYAYQHEGRIVLTKILLYSDDDRFDVVVPSFGNEGIDYLLTDQMPFKMRYRCHIAT